jgi:hypothetical protein
MHASCMHVIVSVRIVVGGHGAMYRSVLIAFSGRVETADAVDSIAIRSNETKALSRWGYCHDRTGELGATSQDRTSGGCIETRDHEKAAHDIYLYIDGERTPARAIYIYVHVVLPSCAYSQKVSHDSTDLRGNGHCLDILSR